MHHQSSSSAATRKRHVKACLNNRAFMVIGAVALFFLMITIMFSASDSFDIADAKLGGNPELQLLEQFAPTRHDLEMPHPNVGAKDYVCAVCTNGLPYVHLGRAATRKEKAGFQELTTSMCPLEAAASRSQSPQPSVEDCLAHLSRLGLLETAQAEVTPKDETCARVVTTLRLDFNTAGAKNSYSGQGRCPAFLAELRPAPPTSPVPMELSYPRLPQWPLPPSKYVQNDAGLDPRDPRPAYFGTAKVQATDADADVAPPSLVELSEDFMTVVLHFERDATSTQPEPFELRCPAFFMSVATGLFGVHHNQLQMMLHTLSFAKHVKRTFVVPAVSPLTETPYVRYDAQRLYGFNALRREGGYCLVTYPEAQAVFRQLAVMGNKLDLRRFNYYGATHPSSVVEGKQVATEDWWHSFGAQLPAGGRPLNIDGWFEDSAAQAPPVTLLSDTREGAIVFHETEEEFNVASVFPDLSDAPHSKLFRMRRATQRMTDLLGGASRATAATDGKHQLRLAVLSGHMAYHLRPSLEMHTRTIGLLRPSANLTAELHRYYAEMAEQLSWPLPKEDGVPQLPPNAALTPQHFRNVMGFNVRGRESTCRLEADVIGDTAQAIDPARYMLDRTNPGWSTNYSTTSSFARDCSLNAPMVLNLYKQYDQWMRTQMTPRQDEVVATTTAEDNTDVKEDVAPTIYMAHDSEAGHIVERVETRLQEWRAEPWTAHFRSATTYPTRFVACFDKHVNGSLRQLHHSATKRANLEVDEAMLTDGEAPEKRRAVILHELYEPALAHMRGIAIDFFVLSNTRVFRGGVLSPMSMNTVTRRWGRGLPCHSVLPGYVESFYTPMWV